MSDKKSIPTTPKKLSDIKQWDIETDVAVIGFGGAGACAAIEAHDSGLEAIIFELASASGGSTALSSAEIYMGGNGGTRVQKATGWEDTTEDMIAYMSASAGPQADEAKIRNYCENSTAHFDWLVEKGVPFKDSEFKGRAIMAMTDDCVMFTGSEKAYPYNEMAKPCPRGHNLEVEGDNGGPLFMKIMTENVEKRGIQVEYETRALTLIADEHNHVHGVVIRKDQKEINIKASKGVILCAGGFVMNEEMLKKYAPQLLRCNAPIGNPGDTGAGIMMGMGVGGAVINMHEGFVTVPYYPPSSLTSGIFINAQGQRFINEDCYHGRVGAHCLQQKGERLYIICSVDQYADYEKVSYLNAEVAGTGETVAELEIELNLPEGQLQHTVEFYNRNAENGKDPLFHKTSEWCKPIEAPFVALDITPGRGAFYPFFTLGGLDTLPSGEVLTAGGEVVKGLYAAGRTACGVPRRGAGYSSGMSVGDATFTGRMAGKAIAAG
jgi:succinate dehydrogenase/fumarate reductase flavoprotein subunit